VAERGTLTAAATALGAALPIPDVAPVTSATLPSRSRTTVALAIATPHVVVSIGPIGTHERKPVVEYSDLNRHRRANTSACWMIRRSNSLPAQRIPTPLYLLIG
jgi:hypothetical protein